MVAAVAVVSLLGFVLVACEDRNPYSPDASRRPTTTSTTRTSTTATPAEPSGRRPLEGFAEVAFAIRGAGAAGGALLELCALLAATADARAQGLMEQDDLRGYDGMLFEFDEPTEGRFWMRNTRIPLSIAFFDERGGFVSATDMEPCPDDVDDCPTYGADGPYLWALEVAQGDLPRVGAEPGSVLEIGTPGDACPAPSSDP